MRNHVTSRRNASCLYRPAMAWKPSRGIVLALVVSLVVLAIAIYGATVSPAAAPPAVRVPPAGRRPGRALVDHDLEEARRLPARVRRLRPPARGALHRP